MHQHCVLWLCKNGVVMCLSVVVVATDRDSVTNSQLTYTVSNPHFKVQTLNNIGYIRTAK